MMSPKRLEEIKKAADDVIADAPLLMSSRWLAHAVRDAVSEIKELNRRIETMLKSDPTL